MFTDKVTLTLSAGRGGNGVVAWLRAKYLPKGGPAGGNGGRGGSIFIKTSNDIFSLDHYRNTTIIKAENGNDGGGNNRHGRAGKDLTILVPCGTLIKSSETGEVLYDLVENGEQIEICVGGRGGLGNSHFKTPTNRTPNKCTQGRPGDLLELEFELKLIADAGFVGLPNAGKSTLLSSLTSNKVKIGDYPFTTLKPNLSYIEYDDYIRIFLADIPGIIKNAHQGRGLGLEFLRHIERSHMLVYVIDLSAQDGHDPFDDFLLLQDELRLYDPRLLEKPFLVALNKCDEPTAQENLPPFMAKYPYPRESLVPISALTGQGLDQLSASLKDLSKSSLV